MYQLIHKKRVQESFPKEETALRMYMVFMISKCSAECSFSTMKLIKNIGLLRSSMCNDRVSHVALMSIYRSGNSASNKLRGPGNQICKKEITKVSLLCRVTRCFSKIPDTGSGSVCGTKY